MINQPQATLQMCKKNSFKKREKENSMCKFKFIDKVITFRNAYFFLSQKCGLFAYENWAHANKL
jgi:hypothetical protein